MLNILLVLTDNKSDKMISLAGLSVSVMIVSRSA